MGQADSSGRSKGASFLFRSRVSLPLDQPNALIHPEAAQPLYPAHKQHVDLGAGLQRDVGLPSPTVIYP